MKRSLYQSLSAACSLLLSFLIFGCGVNGSKPTVDGSSTEANVSGKVFLKGKPASSGTVIFDPSNYLRKNEQARRAEIQKDGSYSIKTLTGSNSVRVEGKEINALRGVDYAGLAYEAPPGQSSFDIKLPPENADSGPDAATGEPKSKNE